MTVRVDVMSLKGGAGKTTIAFRLAWAQAQKSGRPVLIIDADFSGSCLGDLLEPWVNPAWGAKPNLVDLVCDRPETLPERLIDSARFPVYRLRVSPPASGDGPPETVALPISGPSVVFCPSHVDSVETHVGPPVLHALVGHESAGGWVSHVIEAVAQRTEGPPNSLGGVIVDHAPGLSALPWATLRAIGAAVGKGRIDRKAVFVTTADLVDLRAWDGLLAPLETRLMFDALGTQACWAVNRMPPAKPGKPKSLRERLPRPDLVAEGVWLDEASEIPHDAELAAAYAQGGLVQLVDKEDFAIEPLRQRLFGGGTA